MLRVNQTILVASLCIIGFTGGVLVTQVSQEHWNEVKLAFNRSDYLYQSQNHQWLKRVELEAIRSLGWHDLLPESERSLLQHYQNQTELPFEQQFSLALEASTDENYKAALYSINIVEALLDKPVSISGFIVPVETDEDRAILSFFLVPYYGACIHYPPPPPNQMLYAQLETGFHLETINQAYTLTGRLTRGPFEDPLGTSAYLIEVATIKPFQQQPDDFRQH